MFCFSSLEKIDDKVHPELLFSFLFFYFFFKVSLSYGEREAREIKMLKQLRI